MSDAHTAASVTASANTQADAGRAAYARTLPFGAELLDAGRTRFRLWAPSSSAVTLEIEGQPGVPMAALADGWFEIEAACGAGARYLYRVTAAAQGAHSVATTGNSGGTSDTAATVTAAPAALAVPDPASRFQPADVHGPSEVIDPRAYVWQHTTWQGRPWEEVVLYELHVGTLGGYRGVQARLPALAALGVSAIELMPLNDFPGPRNWGYDGVLPFAPDSAYGTPDELKALIDAAHGLGLMVFLDVVYNHFGPDGNYLHSYAESFFKRDVVTPWGPAIDFDAPPVREFFIENSLYWLLEYRFDGLRFDAVHAIDNNGWLRELADRVHATVEPGRQVHLVLENEHNTASLLASHFNAQWSDDAHNTLHVLLTGETESYYEAFADQPVQKLARLLSEGFVYQGEASPIHSGQPRGEPSAALPPSAFVMFLQNHDQVGNRAFGERLNALAEPAALRAATTLMLLSPQIPLLFMGEEWGCTQPFLFFTSYTGDLAQAVRDGRRREFAKFSAFNDAARRAQIPDPNDAHTFELSSPLAPAAPDATQAESLDFYQRALAVRAAQIAPRLRGARALGAAVLEQAAHAEHMPFDGLAFGGADLNTPLVEESVVDALLPSDAPPTTASASNAVPEAPPVPSATARAALLARWRMGDGALLTIALNLGADAVQLELAEPGELLFESAPETADAVAASQTLPGASCAVWLAPAGSAAAA